MPIPAEYREPVTYYDTAAPFHSSVAVLLVGQQAAFEFFNLSVPPNPFESGGASDEIEDLIESAELLLDDEFMAELDAAESDVATGSMITGEELRRR